MINERRSFRTFMLCAFAAALIAGTASLPDAASAAKNDAASGSGMKEIASQAGKDKDSFAPEKGYKMKSVGNLPGSFDLRHVQTESGEKSFVTRVKLQSPYGTCWGFGAISAAESSILAAGIQPEGYGAADDPETGTKMLDLSEKHVAWFDANAINDPDNPQNGEGMKFTKEAAQSERYDIGGAIFLATAQFAQGVGPVSEETATPGTGDKYDKIFEYRGKRADVVDDIKTWFDKQEAVAKEGLVPAYYSEKDDWAIPESLRFKNDYRLRESYVLPSPGALEDDRIDEKTQPIKDQLVNHHRAVAASYCADTYLPTQEGQKNKYISKHWAQYTYDAYAYDQDDDDRDVDPLSANHVVSIIGYDDDYPVENFIEGHRPPGKGAWLVKNSWGTDQATDEEEFNYNGYRHFGILEGADKVPYADAKATEEAEEKKIDDYNAQAREGVEHPGVHTGYFWMSYYDMSLQDPEAYSFEATDKDTEYITDQHDYMPAEEYEDISTDAVNKMANVFTARENQKLTDVSFMTTRPGTSVTYKVYLLNDNFKDPEDGVVVAEIDRTEAKSYKYGGFHKESLGEQAILLQKGQQYSIIVQEKTPAGKYSMSFPKAKSESYLKNNRWIDGVINKNESFFFIDGSWKDLSYKENRQFLKGEQEEWSLDNFPIKGYCENSGTYIDLEKLSVSYDYPKDLVERPGGKIELGITFRGDAVRGSVPKITWTSSDESIFSVEPEADSKGKKANITGKKFGKGFVTVIAGTEDDPSKYGRIVKQVRIRKFHLEDVEFPEGFEKTVYTGKPYTPQPVEVQGESETDKRRVVEKESYIVKYKNNVKCGKGTIYLEGTGDYEGVLDQQMGNPIEFVIHPAKAKINSAVTEKGKLTVKFKSQKESGITGYVLSYKEAGTKTVKEKKLPADATGTVISGLKKGKRYEVSLKAYVTAVVYDEDVYEEVSKDFFGEESGSVKSVEAPPTLKAVQKKIAKIKGNKSLKGAKYKPLALKKGKVTKNSISIKWKKVKDAEKYIVYGGKSGKNKFKKLAGVKGTKRAWTYKKLKANKKYKFLVLAVKKDDGVERVIASSKTICIKTRK